MEKEEIIYLIRQFETCEYDDEEKISRLAGMDEKFIPLLILKETKQTWYSCALVLDRIGYPKIKNHIAEMFEWFQDINWPGALIIVDLLKDIDKAVLLPAVETALLKAAELQDECRVFGIDAFLSFTNIQESDFSSKEVYQILELAEED